MGHVIWIWQKGGISHDALIWRKVFLLWNEFKAQREVGV